MASDSTIKPANIVSPSAAQQPTAAEPKKTGSAQELGQQEFLTLLVNQLQQQDPLNPMNSEEFAVQLAQFSQLETLNRIDQRLEGGLDGSNPIASMATYLGHEVVVRDSLFTVQNNKGSNLLVDVPEGTQSLRVDLIDANGQVAAQHNVEDVTAGRQVLNLDGLQAANGEYDVRVVSVDAAGKFVDLDAKVTATVEGFVLEPEPMLLVNGTEVSLEDITEVHTA